MFKDILSRIQRNHGLEHATLNLLHARYPQRPFAGHSDLGGFWIVGEITAPQLTEVVKDALEQLQSGRQNLALHDNCGTNLLTSGMLAGLAGAAALIGVGDKRRQKLSRIPLIISLATIGLVLSRPLGRFLQKHVTTSGDPGSLQIRKVLTHQQGQLTAHRVQTQG
ncbi:MAG: hypothetical protein KGY46_03035 [Anaerolineales bacterium]|nr:hypothetical protein [Anaerolineales bacterium]